MAKHSLDSNWLSKFSSDNLDRIIHSVGKDNIPPNLDENKLSEGLDECLAAYCAVIALSNSVGAIKDRIRSLKSIRRAAEGLKNRLTPDDQWGGLDFGSDQLTTEIDNLTVRLSSELDRLNVQLKLGPDLGLLDPNDDGVKALQTAIRALSGCWKDRSPFEWIAGHYLPQLLKRHFGVEAKFHRRADDGVPDGVVIRFVERTLFELSISNNGERHSRESIVKAITNVRRGRVRKRPSPKLGKAQTK